VSIYFDDSNELNHRLLRYEGEFEWFEPNEIRTRAAAERFLEGQAGDILETSSSTENEPETSYTGSEFRFDNIAGKYDNAPLRIRVRGVYRCEQYTLESDWSEWRYWWPGDPGELDALQEDARDKLDGCEALEYVDDALEVIGLGFAVSEATGAQSARDAIRALRPTRGSLGLTVALTAAIKVLDCYPNDMTGELEMVTSLVPVVGSIVELMGITDFLRNYEICYEFSGINTQDGDAEIEAIKQNCRAFGR